MGAQKANCKIFTPPDAVISMMDILGYKENLYGRKILENSWHKSSRKGCLISIRF